MILTRTILAITATLAVAGAAAQAPAPPADAAATAQADATFARLDADRDGALSTAEFRIGWLEMQRALEIRERLQAQFRVVDLNHDAALDAGEFSQLVLVREAGAGAPSMAKFDANGNGTLDFSEYVGLVRQMASSRQPPAPPADGKQP